MGWGLGRWSWDLPAFELDTVAGTFQAEERLQQRPQRPGIVGGSEESGDGRWQVSAQENVRRLGLSRTRWVQGQPGVSRSLL